MPLPIDAQLGMSVNMFTFMVTDTGFSLEKALVVFLSPQG